jgi:hypothetical protein
MRVRECHIHSWNAVLRLQAASDFVHHRRTHADAVDGQQHDGRIVLPTNRERFGPDSLCDAFRFRAARSKSVEPNRIVRRDIHLGQPYVISFFGGIRH